MNTPTIFISYSHKDEEWKDRLLTHLDSLQMEDVRAWSDRRLGLVMAGIRRFGKQWTQPACRLSLDPKFGFLWEHGHLVRM